MANAQPETSVDVVNAPKSFLGDLYHQLLRAPWWGLLATILLLYLLCNVAFALCFRAAGGVADARPGSFEDAFFFSVQTLGTIGYGTMHPVSRVASLLVAAESFAAIVFTAITTGLVFSKFSMPTARLAFSRSATISTMDGLRTLAFRVANERGNFVVEAQIRVALIRTEQTAEGVKFFRMHDLNLVRDRSPALGRSWTVLHRLDEKSPLASATPESLLRDEVELLVTIIGIDGTTAQTIHGRHTYADKDVRFGHRHVDMLTELPTGKLQLDYALFHETAPEPAPVVSEAR